jgi:hypothetical protein
VQYCCFSQLFFISGTAGVLLLYRSDRVSSIHSDKIFTEQNLFSKKLERVILNQNNSIYLSENKTAIKFTYNFLVETNIFLASELNTNFAGLEIFIAVTTKSIGSWCVTSCNLTGVNRRFVGFNNLHLHGRRGNRKIY